MAEAIAALGILASIAQLADYGFKLSIKLYTFNSTISSASSTISSISNDVSLTSTVLRELCQIIKSDDAHVVSENTILATKQTVDECLKIFGELDDALNKCLVRMGLDIGKNDEERKLRKGKGNVVLERLKWPFKQPKMDLLRSNLDRLKASLTLMLQVLSYTRDVSSRKEAESSLQYQKQIIESLALSERAMKRRYYALQHALEGTSSEGSFDATINTPVDVATSRDIVDEPPIYQHLSPPFKSSDPVGELLLCFRLLNDLIEHHHVTASDESLADQDAGVFQQALNLVTTVNLDELEKRYGDRPNHIKVEAMKNIQTRLKNIANSYPGGIFVEPGLDADEEEGEEEGVGVEAIKRQVRHTKEEDHVTHPAAPLGPATSRPRSDSLQAEIDATVAIMRDNISKVTQRGEHLDTLQAHTNAEKTSNNGAGPAPSHSKQSESLQAEEDEIVAIRRKNLEAVLERGQHRLMYGNDSDNAYLSEQSKLFYLEAKRPQNEGILTKVYRSVTGGIALAGSESYKSIQGLYEAGSNLFSEPEEDEEGEHSDSHTTQHENIQEVEEEMEEEGDENIVDELLSLWTTLKVTHDDHIDEAISPRNVQP